MSKFVWSAAVAPTSRSAATGASHTVALRKIWMRTLPFLASASLCGHRPQAMLQGTLRNHQPRVFQPLTGERRAFAEFVIAKHGIVPAFDVQVGIVAGTQERVDDFRPVRLAQTGKAML